MKQAGNVERMPVQSLELVIKDTIYSKKQYVCNNLKAINMATHSSNETHVLLPKEILVYYVIQKTLQHSNLTITIVPILRPLILLFTKYSEIICTHDVCSIVDKICHFAWKLMAKFSTESCNDVSVTQLPVLLWHQYSIFNQKIQEASHTHSANLAGFLALLNQFISAPLRSLV